MNSPFKTLATFAALIAGLIAVLVYAKPDINQPPASKGDLATNVLTPDRTLHDFGTISMKDGIVKAIFEIKNEKGTPVALNKMYTSCMCTKATLIIGDENEGPFGMTGHGLQKTFNRKLEPGGAAKIEIAFDPAAHGPSGIGKIERQVFVEGSEGLLLTVNIKAEVTP